MRIAGSTERSLWISRSNFLRVVYILSALNLAFYYSMSRPLYNVAAEEGGEALYVVAGLFGVEFSLPLHLIALTFLFSAHLVSKSDQRRMSKAQAGPMSATNR